MVGWARLHVSGKAGSKVKIRFGEVLKPNGELYTENLRTAEATDTYTLRGKGSETFEPHFTFHGFRYVELTGYPGTPSARRHRGRRLLHGRAVYHPVQYSKPDRKSVVEQYSLGTAREFPERSHRLSATRRTAGLDG